MSVPRMVVCPACSHRFPVKINDAATLSAHLEDDHRWPFQQVMRVVVEACGAAGGAS